MKYGIDPLVLHASAIQDQVSPRGEAKGWKVITVAITDGNNGYFKQWVFRNVMSPWHLALLKSCTSRPALWARENLSVGWLQPVGRRLLTTTLWSLSHRMVGREEQAVQGRSAAQGGSGGPQLQP